MDDQTMGTTTDHRSPSNTTAQTAADPLLMLAATSGPGGFSQAIEEQERHGQAQLLQSTTLPTEGSDDPALLALGFTFGDRVPGDPLFREATLPAGWTREGSDHSMGSYICDERGVRRVNVFYKAAFYDRRASMSLMNVGYSTATHEIYGDDPVNLDARLTNDEVEDLRACAESYVGDAERAPHIYADRLPRAERLIKLIDTARQSA